MKNRILQFIIIIILYDFIFYFMFNAIIFVFKLYLNYQVDF